MSGFEAWAVKALAAGGLVLLAGYLLAKLCRGPARRQAAVAWAVRGSVLAAVVAALPGWLPITLPAPPPAPPASPEVVAPVSEPPLVWEWVESAADEYVVEPPAAEPPPAEPALTPAAPTWPTERWLAVGYALGVTAFGVRLLLGHLALARLTRRASPAPPRVKQRFPGRVFIADRVQSPVCFGVLRPTVLLPRGLAETASAGELDWVLAHEADHLRRGDHRSTWLAAVAGCVFFPLPWFWAVRRELVLAQEFLADAAAAGDRPADYAAYLVHLSASPARLPQLAAGVRAGRSDLSRRVTMLLNEGSRPRRASRRWRLMVGAGTLAGAVVLGGLTVQQAAAVEPKPLAVEVTVAVEEPKVERAIEVEVRLDDEKKADADKENKKAEEKQMRIVLTADAKLNAQQVAKLKDEIRAAAKKGDDEKVAELVEKLEKALRSAPKVVTLDGETKLQGNYRVVPKVVEGKGPMQFKVELDGIDEAIKQLQSQLDAMKDGNPQAKQAMEQALKALKGQAGGMKEWRAVPAPADPFAQKPRFGAAVETVPDNIREQLDIGEKIGIQVAEVREGTPAAGAGLKKGDVIVGFAGKDVASDPNKFTDQVRSAKAGEVKVVVLRKGKKQTLTAELAEATKGPDADALKRRAEEQAKRAEDQAKRAEEQAKRQAENARNRERAARDRAEAGEKRAESRSVSVTINDGKFSITSSGGGTESKLSGTIEDGKPVVESVTVKADGETFKGKSISDVPEKYRAELKKLLGNISVKP